MSGDQGYLTYFFVLKVREKKKNIHTLPKTNITPENRKSQEETIIFQPSILRCKLAVSFRVRVNYLYNHPFWKDDLQVTSLSNPSRVASCLTPATGDPNHHVLFRRWLWWPNHTKPQIDTHFYMLKLSISRERAASPQREVNQKMKTHRNNHSFDPTTFFLRWALPTKSSGMKVESHVCQKVMLVLPIDFAVFWGTNIL